MNLRTRPFPSILLIASLICAPVHAEWLGDEQTIMGTSVRVELWHEDRAKGEAAIAAVMQEMRRIDHAMSPYIESSELSRINREAASGPVVISQEMVDLVALSRVFVHDPRRVRHHIFQRGLSPVNYTVDFLPS